MDGNILANDTVKQSRGKPSNNIFEHENTKGWQVSSSKTVSSSSSKYDFN